jgi:hypothetical protein
MGETRVDLLHLLEDLRDAYTGSIEETILTEVVANALDSGATRIALTANPADRTLTVVDDGSGMTRHELARYHDLAASSKARGHGIGFAGVGIKLGLTVCDDVVTETRRGRSHVATSWRLASRHRAPWHWVPPDGRTTSRGTAVQLVISNSLSPLLDAGFLESTIRRHFAALFDPTFDEVLEPHYAHGVTVLVNGSAMPRVAALDVASPDGAHDAPHEARASITVRLARKRKPAVVGYLERSDTPLPEERQGLAISTFGKVIKRGWEWLGLTPSTPDRIGGLVEAPPLSAALALNKADFIRTGARGATYLQFRKAIQEAVGRQLLAWGDDRTTEPPRPAPVRMREIEQVLEQLAGDFPLLGALVEQRRGGQRALPWKGRGTGELAGTGDPVSGSSPALPLGGLDALDVLTPSDPAASREPKAPHEPNAGDPNAPTPAIAASPLGGPAVDQADITEPPPIELSEARARRRLARYGLRVEFESRPGDVEPARLVDSTVHVNEAHPAYRRAALSRSLGYHIGLSVALALAPLAADAAREHEFLTSFLSKWGEAVDAPRQRSRGRRGT